MKLNGKVLAAAAVATAGLFGFGWVTVVGIDRTDDQAPVGAEQAATEQSGSGTTANAGVEQYRGGYGHAGYGHAWGGRGWGGRGWGGSRWGRWAGGHYVGGRWVGGPYYGWCDDRYYACDRYW